MAGRTWATYIAQMPGTDEPAPDDLMWSVEGGWDDVYNLMNDPYGWVEEHNVALPQDHIITLFFVYPLDARELADSRNNVVIVGASLADVIIVRGARPWDYRDRSLPIPEPVPSIIDTSDPSIKLTITLRPQDSVGYVHFPIRQDEDKNYLKRFVKIVMNPQGLIDELKNYENPVIKMSSGNTPNPISTPGTKVDFGPLEDPAALKNMRIITQIRCPPGTKPCVKGSGSLKQNSATTYTVSLDTLLYTCWASKSTTT
jgi:hypothetical protein